MVNIATFASYATHKTQIESRQCLIMHVENNDPASSHFSSLDSLCAHFGSFIRTKLSIRGSEPDFHTELHVIWSCRGLCWVLLAHFTAWHHRHHYRFGTLVYCHILSLALCFKGGSCSMCTMWRKRSSSAEETLDGSDVVLWYAFQPVSKCTLILSQATTTVRDQYCCKWHDHHGQALAAMIHFLQL